MHTAVEAFHGPTDLAIPLPLCAARTCNERSMNARTVDVKIAFERYDGIPGPACRTFRRNLLQCRCGRWPTPAPSRRALAVLVKTDAMIADVFTKAVVRWI